MDATSLATLNTIQLIDSDGSFVYVSTYSHRFLSNGSLLNLLVPPPTCTREQAPTASVDFPVDWWPRTPINVYREAAWKS
jgi:hypothetical protein